ncbi:FMN-binding protein [Syntrophomonas erecta]
MPKRTIGWTVLLVIIAGLLAVVGCSEEDNLTGLQLKGLNQIINGEVTAEQIEMVSISPEAAEKFPAVAKMFKIAGDGEGNYGLLVKPVGYRAPISVMVVIDDNKQEVMGIKVIQQNETPGWGEWLAETWFTDRFKGKNVHKYLERAILEAKEDNEIIQITSATVTTQAVLNGVNAAMGIYREVVLEEEAEPVPLKVEEFITESQ